jgi:hypothetical protein
LNHVYVASPEFSLYAETCLGLIASSVPTEFEISILIKQYAEQERRAATPSPARGVIAGIR